jgi:hypothetical protein
MYQRIGGGSAEALHLSVHHLSSTLIVRVYTAMRDQHQERTKEDGGMLLDSTSCGMLVQVSTQWNPSCRLTAASITRPLIAGVKVVRATKAAQSRKL